MKKIGIRISLLCILVAVLLFVPISAVNAAPNKVYITINTLQPEAIEFSYGWNKIWAYSYSVQIDNISQPDILYHDGDDFDGGRVKEFNSGLINVPVNINSGDSVTIYLDLYDKFGRSIHNGSLSIEVTCQ